MLGKWLIYAAVCLTGLQAGIIFAWPRGLFVLMLDGKADISLSSQDQISVVNTMYVFKLIGSAVCAFLMEKHGRRTALIVISALNLLSWLPNFLGSSVAWFCLSEAFHGIFINVFVMVMPVVVGETMEAEIRGSVASLNEVLCSFGVILSSVLGMTNYTAFNAIPVIPSIAMVVVVSFIKETPYFTVMRHGKDKARERFIWLRGKCDENELIRMEEQIHHLKTQRRGIKDLFRRNTRKSLGIVTLFGVLSKVSGHDIIANLLPFLLPKSSMSSSTAVSISSFFSLCSTFISMLLIDRVGRKPLTFASFFGSALSFFGVGTWYFIHEHTAVDVDSVFWIPLLLFLGAQIFGSLGCIQLYHVLTGEMFTTDVSGRASVLVALVSAICTTLFNQAFYPVKNALGMTGAMFMCCGFNIIGCVCVCAFLVETKGKTLEDIQIEISKRDVIPQEL